MDHYTILGNIRFVSKYYCSYNNLVGNTCNKKNGKCHICRYLKSIWIFKSKEEIDKTLELLPNNSSIRTEIYHFGNNKRGFSKYYRILFDDAQLALEYTKILNIRTKQIDKN